MINHCDRGITHLNDTDTVQAETYHDKSLCDRGITHPNDTDTVQLETYHDKSL
jgi:hypothetical protein